MKEKKVRKVSNLLDTYLIAQAVNHNAELLEDALNRIKALEPFKNAYIQVAKERDIAIEQLNELGYSLGEKIEPCNKVRAEIEAQEKLLAEAGYNAYNVDIAFGSIKRALRK